MIDLRPRIRRAKKHHQCSERGYHSILPGQLYLYQKCPPWHDYNRTGKWEVDYTCLPCAKEFGLIDAETLKSLESAGHREPSRVDSTP